MPASVFTIPSSAPFADTFARGLIERLGSDPLKLADVTIYLPTRRSVRTLSESFARLLDGAALLPAMRPLGDVDEDQFYFDTEPDFDLPPAIEPVRRRLLLATLVQRWHEQQRGAPIGLAEAAALARSLTRFLDEAQTQSADLSRLSTLVDAPLAQHWEEVLGFLDIVRTHWPDLLAAERCLDPAEHRNRAIAALAERLERKPPQAPVFAAGSTGSIRASANLLRVIANLPNGAVILPGLDRALDETGWNAIDANHPQYGMRQLLQHMDVPRTHVRDWVATPPPRAARETLLRETLRPAPTTDAWRAIADSDSSEIAEGLRGLSLVTAAHPGEEALAIALILREALETKGKTAALVTPDRNLARRVAGEMLRWNIAIDDSAGRPLSKTAPGAFLSLLADAAQQHFAPVPLLALLKHPLTSCGWNTARFRARVRVLDRLVLRGPRPEPGLAGIAGAIAQAERRERLGKYDRMRIASLKSWFAQVSEILQPLEQLTAKPTAGLSEIAGVHTAAAEKLARTPEQSGRARLWAGDAGEAAATLLSDLRSADIPMPAIAPGDWAALWRAFADERPVRPRYGRHPRLSILGPLEARLQSFDVVVLGGLNEGTWPRAVSADPWLSRPMRKALDLEMPERAFGLSAHDFAALASHPRVFLTRALKVEGTPTVASRWVQRLEQLLTGLNLQESLKSYIDYAACAAALDSPPKDGKPEPRPEPKPPLEKRPRRLSVTEIETWIRDPYAIYAKHVLRLKPLEPLDADIGAPERGTAVHKALELFLKEYGDRWPADPAEKLIAIGHECFRDLPKATRAVWQPRFEQAARWFAEAEGARRAQIVHSHVEQAGTRIFAAPGGDFTLSCKADRIDMLAEGGAAIVDYKTGTPPSLKQVKQLWAPQLPLEAAILDSDGGFPNIGRATATELLYIKYSGGTPPGEFRDVGVDIPDLVERAEARLRELIAYYDNPDNPYRPRLFPYRDEIPGEYDHLSRVREWSRYGWEESGDD